MSRDLTTAMANAISDPHVIPCLFMQLETATTTVRYWTGIGSRSWNSQTWLGVGALIEMSPVEETASVEAKGLAFRIAGLPAAAVQEALNDIVYGKPGKVWFGVLDATGAIVADPKVLMSGKLDNCEVDEEDPLNCTIVLSIENKLADLQRPREWRLTHEHQQELYPGDKGLEYVASLVDKVVIW